MEARIQLIQQMIQNNDFSVTTDDFWIGYDEMNCEL